jgi:hypothetical protein
MVSQTQASNKPVWTVAWVVVPEVNVQVGPNLLNVTDDPVFEQDFINAAEHFKWYIENYTNDAVEVRIDHIIVESVPTFTSTRNDRISLSPRVTNAMVLRNITKGTNIVDVTQYDTLMAYWPFGEDNPNFHPGTNGGTTGIAYSCGREAYVTSEVTNIFVNPTMRKWDYVSVTIHEFLHLTELWFRDIHGFPLPFELPAGYTGENYLGEIGDRNALHNPKYFGFGLGGLSLREIVLHPDEWVVQSGDADIIAYYDRDIYFKEAWLGFRVPDPQNPGRMLGIPPNAWNYTPTNGKKPVHNLPGGEPVTEVIVHSTTPDTATINLTTETITLPTGYTVAAFSVDGGTKWRRGALPVATRFPRMLNKGMTLHITDNWNQSAKRPGDGAQTITFPAIGARPKRNAERLVPSYGDSHWVLAKRNTTAAVFTGYEIAPSSNRKTPDNGTWFPMPEGGIPISSGSVRQTFLVRAAPNGSPTAGSVAWRVRPVNFGKAPNYRIRDAKISGSTDRVPAIAFRKGDQYAIGDGEYTPALTAKTTIPVSQLAAQGTEVHIRRAATGKKPPSMAQTVAVSP